MTVKERLEFLLKYSFIIKLCRDRNLLIDDSNLPKVSLSILSYLAQVRLDGENVTMDSFLDDEYVEQMFNVVDFNILLQEHEKLSNEYSLLKG